MSSNDSPSDQKEPEDLANAPSTPNATRPPPPSERKAGPSMPPPPPRRSVKPSMPPPPPIRNPTLRPAGVFSMPPPPVEPTPPVAERSVASPPAAPEADVAPPTVDPEAPPPVAAAPEPAAPPALSASPTLPQSFAPSAPPQPSAPSAPPQPSAPSAPPQSFAPTPPPQPFAPSVQSPASAGSSLAPLSPPQPALESPPLSARIGAVQARIVSAVPPRWLEVARQYPVLWLVVAPVFFALLLIVIVAAFEQEPRPETEHAQPIASEKGTATAQPETTTTTPAKGQAEGPSLANLEGKDRASLSVKELLLLNEGGARRKRDETQALSNKLQAEPELVQDQAVQAQLLRFAADPDTAADALAAMARAKAPVGPDLLYEVWTSRVVSPGTAELARSLLYSRDVRPGASPALTVALELRAAADCEAVAAALPQAQAEGDARSLIPLSKVNARRGCGEKKTEDCYACLRARTKQVIAASKAAKSRRAPSYPALPPR